MRINKKNINEKYNLIISIIFAFFPLALIAGNFIVNVNILIFCLFSFYYLRYEILKFKFNIPLKIIFIFFITVFVSTLLNYIISIYYNESNLEHYPTHKDNLNLLIKSFLYFRYFIFLLIIHILIYKKFLNLKYFLYSSACCVFLISLDIIYQYFYGYNILGFENYLRFNSSFFNDEHVAGGYLQNFCFFLIFSIFYLFKEKRIFVFFLTLITISILGSAILLSGNRMPLLLFMLGLFALILLFPKKRLTTFMGLTTLIALLYLMFSLDSKLKDNFGYALTYLKHPIAILKIIYPKHLDQIANNEENLEKKVKQKIIYPPDSMRKLNDSAYLNRKGDSLGHAKLFAAAVDTWKLNKLFGGGIKSFFWDCKRIQLKEHTRICGNHPHNYYLQILTETGLVGISLVILLGILFIRFIIKNLKALSEDRLENLILMPSIISLILIGFPIRSSGSFFTTSNITYIILIVSIVLSAKQLLENEKKNNVNK